MLPPCRSGGIVERGPVSGATPTSPQNGASGRRMPGQNSTRSAPGVRRVIFRWPSGKSSASSPKPEIEAVQPQSAGVKSSRSTWSVSPGSAPSTATGPVTWSTRSKSRVASALVVESAVIWPFEASRQSKSTTSPEPTWQSAGWPGPRPGGSARVRSGRSASGATWVALCQTPQPIREGYDANAWTLTGSSSGSTTARPRTTRRCSMRRADSWWIACTRSQAGSPRDRKRRSRQWSETMDLVLRDTGTDRSRVVAVGLDTPGPASAVGVISTRGATNFAQPAWWGFDVRGALEAHIGLPVVYNNDGNAAALYAHHVHFGADAPMHSSVSAVVGTGLGGGVIEAGLVVRGAAGMAGELGHVQIFTDGLLADDQPMPTCACGNSGDVESLASLTGIARNLLPYWLTRYPEHPIGGPADRPGGQGGAHLRRRRRRDGAQAVRPAGRRARPPLHDCRQLQRSERLLRRWRRGRGGARISATGSWTACALTPGSGKSRRLSPASRSFRIATWPAPVDPRWQPGRC